MAGPWGGGGQLTGPLQQLPIAQGTGGLAIATPLGMEDFNGPAEAFAGATDGRIGATGPAMEQAHHGPALAIGQQG